MKKIIRPLVAALGQSLLLLALLASPAGAQPFHSSPNSWVGGVFAKPGFTAARPHWLRFQASDFVGRGVSQVKLPALPSLHLVPLLAQASPEGPVDSFLSFLAKVFLILGAIVIAFGGYETSRGRVLEGLVSTLGGLMLSLSIPLMKWLLHITGAMN